LQDFIAPGGDGRLPLGRPPKQRFVPSMRLAAHVLGRDAIGLTERSTLPMIDVDASHHLCLPSPEAFLKVPTS
jgi:hypothetical protein